MERLGHRDRHQRIGGNVAKKKKKQRKSYRDSVRFTAEERALVKELHVDANEGINVARAATTNMEGALSALQSYMRMLGRRYKLTGDDNYRVADDFSGFVKTEKKG